MIRPTTRSTSTDTLFPYTTLLRSQAPCPGPRLRGAFPLRLERTWPRRLVALAGAEADARGVRAAARHARRLHPDPLPRQDRKSTRLNSSHYCASRLPSSALKKTNILFYLHFLVLNVSAPSCIYHNYSTLIFTI